MFSYCKGLQSLIQTCPCYFIRSTEINELRYNFSAFLHMVHVVRVSLICSHNSSGLEPAITKSFISDSTFDIVSAVS
ncbi:uncharacterized protein DS421_1g19710 [Arachis hypogaea]|nr:uncharacterized protein DS421_1g19710 [Arachis hypogaea]